MERALIVKQPYADLIMTGQKRLEMRGRHTKVRGRIGIIPKGSGVIIGSVELVTSIDYSNDDRLHSIGGQCLHQIKSEDWHLLKKWPFGWLLNDPHIFKEPKKYKHPQGAVTWVRVPNLLQT